MAVASYEETCASRELREYRESTILAHREAAERVIREMRRRFDEPLLLSELAKIACLSPFHFDRVFRQITGIAPSQFLYALRIEAAKKLLLTTSRSVTEICYEVGYNSLGTFTYRFTQLVGLSPVRLRRLFREFPDGALDALLKSASQEFSEMNSPELIGGFVKTPSAFDGPVFAGLFSTRIPQGRPLGGTLLMGPGKYGFESLSDGRYYILAAGFLHSIDAIRYWLPDNASLLVGVGHNPIVVSNGVLVSHSDVILRPVAPTDPPILVALPALIAS